MSEFPLFSPELNLSLCPFVSSTASNSPRSTPGSSPSLRRRVLGGGRASESEGGGGEKSSGGGGGGSDSPLPSIPSASSLTSAYPLASRHFSRNAKVTQNIHLQMDAKCKMQEVCRYADIEAKANNLLPVFQFNVQHEGYASLMCVDSKLFNVIPVSNDMIKSNTLLAHKDSLFYNLVVCPHQKQHSITSL